MEIVKDPKVLIKLDESIALMLSKFQGDYQAETGKRLSKREVINRALEVYITKCYELSKE